MIERALRDVLAHHQRREPQQIAGHAVYRHGDRLAIDTRRVAAVVRPHGRDRTASKHS